MKTKHGLPKGVNSTDLDRPDYDAKGANALYLGPEGQRDYTMQSFEIWFTAGFGWCITTLSISGHGARTYAVTATDFGRTRKGAVVRIGKGPHVLERVVVWVRVGRVKALMPFLDLRTQGAGGAGQIRDRISSRRAQGQLERQAGNRSWRWDV